jgi:hypothetical protein
MVEKFIEFLYLYFLLIEDYYKYGYMNISQ